MRVLAARFSDRGIASAVRETIQRRLHLASSDVEIAPLGLLGRPTATDTVLAGRFPDDQAPLVAAFVREVGGEVVANVDETWTRPRPASRRNVWNGALGRGGYHA